MPKFVGAKPKIFYDFVLQSHFPQKMCSEALAHQFDEKNVFHYLNYSTFFQDVKVLIDRSGKVQRRFWMAKKFKK